MMEDSKSSDPPRCSCGFFGSSSTLGMCSKCYKAHQEKTQDSLRSTPDHMIRKQDSGKPLVPSTHGLEAATPQPSSSTGESCYSEGTKDCGDNKYEEQSKSLHTTDNSLCINTESQGTCLTSAKHERLSEDISNTNGNELQNGKNSDNTSHQSPSTSSSDIDQELRGLKRDISALESDSTPESTPEKGKQKNRKRCHHCNAKLELAQRQIGRCRCEYIFCALHRLPELHNCDFDHKEDGRREARQKMVKPTRHLGNAFRRIDSDS